MTPLYSIGSAARMLDVSVQTLRMYEREGLVIIRKSESNQRLYSDDDIERIRCIRHALTEQKMSIEGVRRMQAMVPCWAMVGCPPIQRNSCEAFLRNERGCWSYMRTDSYCSGRDCRACVVYRASTDCSSVRSSIVSSTLRPASEGVS